MEFVIWGIAPQTTVEQLLLVNYQGNKITDHQVAERLLKILTDKGCTNCRIQSINLGNGFIQDFKQAIQ